MWGTCPGPCPGHSDTAQCGLGPAAFSGPGGDVAALSCGSLRTGGHTRATNIGWTVAFHKVSAIVTDIGAPLSHAAIVAREFGIPAVVGCRNATSVLKTGDVVTVDGSKGTVVIEKT